MKRIAVLTSGGDAPGMNAAIRAVVRTGLHFGLEVFGIYRGYDGLIKGTIKKLKRKDVSNIIQSGGTILFSARSEEFKTIEGRKKAFKSLKKHEIDGLIVIGGDGTFTGADIFQKEHNIPIVGLPGTIDNDLYGTDFTIGYDTAINTAMEAIDNIKDTANAHDRLFFIEVMGRDAGFIALRSGIATGAEAVLIPENKTNVDELIDKLEASFRNKKTSSIVIVAEGDDAGGAFAIAEKVKAKFDHYDIRVTILGHVQRGGRPTAMERVRASKLGYEAVKALLAGHQNEMIGLINNKIAYTSFAKSIKHHQRIDPTLVELVEILG
jgi:6-phosphofructokinase 1